MRFTPLRSYGAGGEGVYTLRPPSAPPNVNVDVVVDLDLAGFQLSAIS